jgi:hypothetical protein
LLCGQKNENEVLLQTATLDMTSGTDMITRQLHKLEQRRKSLVAQKHELETTEQSRKKQYM